MGIVNIVARLPLSFAMVAGHRDEVMVLYQKFSRN